jgi:glycosyltransferase involved in cell wall biosynthesis
MSATEEPAPDRPIKVSVIVPTYCSGPGLSRVIDSLDGQSMAQHDFESVFVDDGSPDDTLAQLEELASHRPNMRVTSIPNSGWPSRPRNVGVGMARGEFVVFMDHDDELFPSALEHAWSFAHQHGLDALTAKEMKTSSPFFTWAAFAKDVAPPEPRRPALLSPMTPHKM